MKSIFKIIAFLAILPGSGCLLAQSNYFAQSNLILISETKGGQELKYTTHDAYMVLNMATGDFMLNADLSDLETGDRRTDSILQSQGEQRMVFKGNISENILAYSQQQNDERNYDMPGQLSINGSTFACTAQFDPINLADKNESRNYRMDLRLAVDAGKMAVKGLETKFTKQVVLEIAGGRLNVQN